jgi:hypothetical protein
MKKLICIFVSLLLLCLSFAGCGKNDNEKIIGKWESRIVDDSNPSQPLVNMGEVVFEFFDEKTGIKTVNHSVGGEAQTYFEYSIDSGVIIVSCSNGVTDDYILKFDGDDKMYLIDQSLDATEEFIRVKAEEK